MRKFFQAIGMITLLCFSFFYTERTVSVVKDFDSIMVEVKEKSSQYNVQPKEATVKGNTIIPGKMGKTVDINKSYIKMKEYGKFDPKLLVYDNQPPQKRITKNYDKFVISGNKQQRSVGLIFLVGEHDSIDEILRILAKKDTPATFFIDGNWLEQHIESLKLFLASGHTVGNLSYHQNYQDSSFVWVDTIIKRIGKQKQSYCYAENKEQNIIDVCHLYEDITITPNIITEKTPLLDIKKKLEPGSMIKLEVNDTTKEELPSIIQFIKSKGYQLENLEHLIQE